MKVLAEAAKGMSVFIATLPEKLLRKEEAKTPLRKLEYKSTKTIVAHRGKWRESYKPENCWYNFKLGSIWDYSAEFAYSEPHSPNTSLLG